MPSCRPAAVVLVASALIAAVSCTAFTTCWLYYYAPRRAAAYARLELTCRLSNITLYGSTCERAKTACVTVPRGGRVCTNERITEACERALLLWSFPVNGSLRTDTRDVIYGGERVNDTRLCWWDGQLSFDSPTRVLVGPRVVVGIVGFFAGLLLLAALGGWPPTGDRAGGPGGDATEQELTPVESAAGRTEGEGSVGGNHAAVPS